MTFLKKYRWTLFGVTAVLALVLVGAAVLPMVAAAQGVPWDRMSQRGFPGDFPNAPTNHNQDLADALGITVDKLETAQKTARDAALARAVEDGGLIQERVEQMTAMRDLMNYFQEQGVPEQIKTVIADAVQAAVDDGVISREQADEFLSHDGFGPGFDSGFPGMRVPCGHDFHGKRGFPGFGDRDGGDRGRPDFRGFGDRNFTPPIN